MTTAPDYESDSACEGGSRVVAAPKASAGMQFAIDFCSNEVEVTGVFIYI